MNKTWSSRLPARRLLIGVVALALLGAACSFPPSLPGQPVPALSVSVAEAFLIGDEDQATVELTLTDFGQPDQIELKIGSPGGSVVATTTEPGEPIELEPDPDDPEEVPGEALTWSMSFDVPVLPPGSDHTLWAVAVKPGSLVIGVANFTIVDESQVNEPHPGLEIIEVHDRVQSVTTGADRAVSAVISGGGVREQAVLAAGVSATAPEGLLMGVTSVQDNADGTQLATGVTLSLPEVIPYALVDPSGEAGGALGAGLHASAVALPLPDITETWSIDCGSSSVAELEVSLTPQIDIGQGEVRWTASAPGVEWGLPPSIDWDKMDFSGSVAIDASLTGSARLSVLDGAVCSSERELASATVGRYCPAVLICADLRGAVVASAEISTDAGFTAEGTVTAGVEVQGALSKERGFEFDWDPYFEHGFEVDFSLPESATARVQIMPMATASVGLGFSDLPIVGDLSHTVTEVSAGVGPFLEAKAELCDGPRLTFDVGAHARGDWQYDFVVLEDSGEIFSTDLFKERVLGDNPCEGAHVFASPTVEGAELMPADGSVVIGQKGPRGYVRVVVPPGRLVRVEMADAHSWWVNYIGDGYGYRYWENQRGLRVVLKGTHSGSTLRDWLIDNGSDTQRLPNGQTPTPNPYPWTNTPRTLGTWRNTGGEPVDVTIHVVKTSGINMQHAWVMPVTIEP